MPSKEEYKNDAKRALLTQSLATIATGSANENIARLGAGLQGQSSNMAQAAQQGIAEEEAKKKKKSGLFGKLGSIGGGIVGAALAPATGGLSLALPALGSAAGGTIGEMVGGGTPSFGNALGYGAQGAMGSIMGKGLGALAPAGKSTAEIAANAGMSEALPATASAVAPAASRWAGALPQLMGQQMAMGGNGGYGMYGGGMGALLNPNVPGRARMSQNQYGQWIDENGNVVGGV